MSARRIEDIRIASPCSASWEEMKGDDRVRFCAQCQLNVYNLSEMTREEVTDLLRRREGQTCFRFYRRDDGTILTRDCPVGLRAVRRAARRGLTLAGAFIVALLATLAGAERDRLSELLPREADPFASFLNWIYPPPSPLALSPPTNGNCVMGADW